METVAVSWDALSPRARRLLDLRAAFGGTMYETYRGQDGETHFSLPWETDTDSDGNRIPMRKRRPLVQSKSANALIERVVDLAVNPDGFPQIVIEPISALAALVDKTLFDDGLDLEAYLPEVARSMLQVGSAIIGFIFDDAGQDGGHWALDLLEPEWCSGFTVSDMRSPWTEKLLSAYEALGIAVLDPQFGRPEHLALLDVIKPIVDGDGITWWTRRIVTADVFYDFAPMRASGAGAPPAYGWTTLRTIDNPWGVVPYIWGRIAGASDPGARTDGSEWIPLDGIPLVDARVLSVIAARDRTLSAATASCWYGAHPTLAETDLRPIGRNSAVELALDEGNPNLIADAQTGPRSILTYQSTSRDTQGRAQLLETTGQGTLSALKVAEALRNEIFESTGVQLPDPAKASQGVVTGEALKQANAATIAVAQAVRGGLRSLIRELIAKLGRAVAIESELTPSTISAKVIWPPVYRPTPADVQQMMQGLASAATSRILAIDSLAEYAARWLGLYDPANEKQKAADQFGELLSAATAAARTEGAPDASPPDAQGA